MTDGKHINTAIRNYSIKGSDYWMSEKKVLKARFVDVLMELGLGLLFVAILIGKVAIPAFIVVSTAGWDSNVILVWNLIPLILVGSVGMAIIYHVKYGFLPVR